MAMPGQGADMAMPGREAGASGTAGAPLDTGVPGLDTILGGGLPRGSLTLVAGPPGAGKTVLALQVAVHRARLGGRAVILTALSESHERLLAALAGLSFHDPALLGERLQLLSLTGLLADGDLEAAARGVVRTVRAQRPELVVVDGFGGVAAFAPSAAALHRFLAQLRGALALLGCTTLLTAVEMPDGPPGEAVATIADTVLVLRQDLAGWRARRTLQVQKLRAGAPLDGRHAFAIGADGLACFPRQEKLPAREAPVPGGARAAFGLPELDGMLGGGLPAGSAAVVCGAAGTGKTLLGLHYLAQGLGRGEPGVWLGFHEGRADLLAKARAFGLDLAAALDRGQLALLLHTPAELEADRLVAALRAGLERGGARRVVVDTAQDLEAAVAEPARARAFFAALLADLRGRGVTTLATLGVSRLVGWDADLAGSPLVALADDVLLLRHLEHGGALRRVLAVVGMRQSAYDSAIREFRIAPGAVRVVPAPESPAGLLADLGRRAGGAAPGAPAPGA